MLAKTAEKENFTDEFEHIIDLIQSQGFTDIKADHPGFDTPDKLVSKSDNKTYTPDITAIKNDSLAYFEIAQKTEERLDLIGKWKLLELLAQMKGGEFKIFVPRGHMKFTRELIKEHDIKAEIIKL